MTDTRADLAPRPAVAEPERGGALLHPWAVLVATVATLGLVAAVGFVVGADMNERHRELGGWHTGTAHVGVNVVSIDYDGWVYGASGSVNAWIDRSGSWHDSGWPTCLRVPVVSGGPAGEVPVRFAAHEITVDDQTWRPIVAVDCRGTAPAR